MQFFLPILVMWQEVKFHICYMPWPGKCILSLAKGFDKASCILGWLPLLFWPLFSICLHLQYKKKIHRRTTYRFVFFAWSDLKKKVILHSCHRADKKNSSNHKSNYIHILYFDLTSFLGFFGGGGGARRLDECNFF